MKKEFCENPREWFCSKKEVGVCVVCLVGEKAVKS